MPHFARPRLVLVGLVAALGLAGCTTPRAKPALSAAVADARAHRNAPRGPTCAQEPLAAVSPVTIGFAFNEAELTDSMARALTEAGGWLACHPEAAATVLPDADGHGSEADQDGLARRRADAVKSYLVRAGVAAERVQILGRAAAPPTAEVFLIRAEGRRW